MSFLKFEKGIYCLKFIMEKIIKIFDIIITKFWLAFCVCVFLGALFIKAKYNFADFPYFGRNTLYDFVLLVFFLFLYLFLFKISNKIEKKVKYWMLWLFFGSIAILYVVLVPLKPFSDMRYVADGALLFGKRDIDGIMASEYLQMITKNMKVSLFYSIFLLVLPTNILSLKVINVFFYLFIVQFISLIASNLGFKYSKTVFIIMGSFFPLVLYCNHIYFDLPTLLMCSMAVYFYTSEYNIRNLILCAVCLGIGSSLRILVFILLIAIVIDYIFKYHKELFVNKGRKCIILLTIVIIGVGIPKVCDKTINSFFRVENAQDESIWTLFWMGINEEEFGFMHIEIADGSKNFSDFYNLLISRDVKRNCKLFGRKVFWEWTQGTYQVQRYAFGAEIFEMREEEQLTKFQYITPVTRFLLNDEQLLRRTINDLCRAQYLALFLFMIIGMFNMADDEMNKYRMFIYLMFGTFLVLFFYELKSRYVLHCLIPMVVLALRGCERVSKRSLKRGG